MLSLHLGPSWSATIGWQQCNRRDTKKALRALLHSCTSPSMSSVRVPVSDPSCPLFAHAPDPPEQPQVVFTRQLWQRNMQVGIDNTPQLIPIGIASNNNTTQHDGLRASTDTRRTSSISVDSQQRTSPTPSQEPDTPLTPEELAPYRNAGRKRSAEDDDNDRGDNVPSHSRDSSGGSFFQLCLCQPEAKVPRPRNGGLPSFRKLHSLAPFPFTSMVSVITADHLQLSYFTVSITKRASSRGTPASPTRTSPRSSVSSGETSRKKRRTTGRASQR